MASTDAMVVTWAMEAAGDAGPDDNQHRPYYELYTAARFITGLILYPIICLFGLTGNALIIFVLVHKAALSSTDVLLAALAISDAVKLINDLLYSATCATMQAELYFGQPFFYMAFACCVNVYLVSVHTSSM